MSKNEQVGKIAEAVKEKLSIDVSSGVAVATVDGDLYAELLPEGLTLETTENVHNYDRDYVAGVTKGFGLAAVDSLRDNPKVNEATLEIAAGKGNTLSLSTERSHEYTVNIGASKGTSTTKFGVTAVKLSTIACKTGSGELKAVLKEIGQYGLEQLKK